MSKSAQHAQQLANQVLRVAELHVKLGGNKILHDINFGIASGELVGLIGPNGAGKTTLMRSIMQLIPVSNGTVQTVGKLGYVPQRQDLDWHYPISVEQLVRMTFVKHSRLFFRREKARDSAKLKPAAIWAAVYKALRQVDLYELRGRTIDELSGGQKQRVLIARALAANPTLLLLDEPFTGLDHPNQDALADLFLQLRNSGVAILMSTHDLTQAVDICDRLVMINRSVRAVGAPADLLDRDLWMKTYEVQENSALLRMLGMGVKL
ncbi:ATP-binding cassette domain-containing protein [Arcanobacterium hippocoleae]